MYIIAVDPGLTGGVTIIDLDKKTISAYLSPSFPANKKKKTKAQFDAAGMAGLLPFAKNQVLTFAIELVGAMPGQGVTSMFRFGFGTGIWHGIAAAKEYAITKITPQKWKKEMYLSQDKDDSISLATKLFPECTHMWKLKKHDGIAERALIGFYIAKTLGYDITGFKPGY